MLRGAKEKIALYAGYIIIIRTYSMPPSTYMFSISVIEPYLVASVTWSHFISSLSAILTNPPYLSLVSAVLSMLIWGLLPLMLIIR